MFVCRGKIQDARKTSRDGSGAYNWGSVSDDYSSLQQDQGQDVIEAAEQAKSADAQDKVNVSQPFFLISWQLVDADEFAKLKAAAGNTSSGGGGGDQ